MNIPWHRVSWHPWGKTIGYHEEYYHRIPGVKFYSNVFPEGTEKLCKIGRYTQGGKTKPHYVVHGNYADIWRTKTLKAALRLAEMFIKGEPMPDTENIARMKYYSQTANKLYNELKEN